MPHRSVHCTDDVMMTSWSGATNALKYGDAADAYGVLILIHHIHNTSISTHFYDVPPSPLAVSIESCISCHTLDHPLGPSINHSISYIQRFHQLSQVTFN